VDDLRIGRIARVLRQRLRWRQVDVARAAACSQGEVSKLELGRIGGMSLRRLRALFAALDADLVVYVRWRGGELDQLLDARHAALGEAATAWLGSIGWTVIPEVTYSILGERGSIDLLAWHPETRTLLVIELKTELTSIEETLRRHDVKVRLASSIARERFGWMPAAVGRLLVLPEDRTARRRVEQHRSLFQRAYPSSGVAVRRWLRVPVGSLAGILFLPGTTTSRTRRRVSRTAA
jgi:transcriptional regulator with XRE-family HTH domain